MGMDLEINCKNFNTIDAGELWNGNSKSLANGFALVFDCWQSSRKIKCSDICKNKSKIIDAIQIYYEQPINNIESRNIYNFQIEKIIKKIDDYNAEVEITCL